jgi:CheY-like chemotaxis protein
VRNHRILIVEDDPDVRNLIVEILEAEGYGGVHAASGGTEAVDVLARHAYDLILTDLRSAIFVTGHMDAKDYASFLTEPAGLMLPKPFTPLELCQVIRRALAMPERDPRPRHPP